MSTLHGRIAPAAAGVVAYEWQTSGENGQDNNEGRLESGADGSADLPFTPRVAGGHNLTAAAVFDDGSRSQPAWFSFEVKGAVEAYLWHVENGPVQEVASADGTWATLPYTPTSSGVFRIYVQARFTDGVLSPTTTYQFRVGR